MSLEYVNLLDNQVPYRFEYHMEYLVSSITLSERVVIVRPGLKVKHLMMHTPLMQEYLVQYFHIEPEEY